MTVYFITELPVRSPAPVKIGFARSAKGVSQRMKALQTGNPAIFDLIGICEDASQIDEQNIHEYLHRFHHRGEWFRIPLSVLAELLVDGWPNHLHKWMAPPRLVITANSQSKVWPLITTERRTNLAIAAAREITDTTTVIHLTTGAIWCLVPPDGAIGFPRDHPDTVPQFWRSGRRVTREAFGQATQRS